MKKFFFFLLRMPIIDVTKTLDYLTRISRQNTSVERQIVKFSVYDSWCNLIKVQKECYKMYVQISLLTKYSTNNGLLLLNKRKFGYFISHLMHILTWILITSMRQKVIDIYVNVTDNFIFDRFLEYIITCLSKDELCSFLQIPYGQAMKFICYE